MCFQKLEKGARQNLASAKAIDDDFPLPERGVNLFTIYCRMSSNRVYPFLKAVSEVHVFNLLNA
jgi:hypothetical protein